MRPPIVAFCQGDLAVYDSVEDAVKDMEPIDVAEGRWCAFDAEGRLLRIVLAEELRPPSQTFLQKVRSFFTECIGPEGVRIMEEEREPTHGNELRDRLTSFFSEVGMPMEPPADRRLDELVGHARKWQA